MNRRITALSVLLLLTGVLYWPSLHAPFLFDDLPNLSALSSIDHVSSWRDLGIYLSQARGFPGRPLAMLSFLLQKSAWPDDPFAFRLVNLGIHLFNGLLLYLLTLRLARIWLSDKVDASSLEGRAHLAALLAAAAWLLNPIQLAGVALIIQRMTLLSALFIMAGLLAYLRGLLAEDLASGKRAAWMVLGLGVCMGMSFLSKENGILLPLLALILDATLLRAQVQRLSGALRWVRRLLIWPVILFVAGFLVWVALQGWGHHGTRPFTVGERLLTEPRILFNYLGKIFLPHFGVYGLYHDAYPVSHSLWSPWTTLPSLIGLAAILAGGFFARTRWPLLALAIFWYFGGQILESSSVMLELYFEHRNYVPLVGIVIALGLAVAGMQVGPSRRLALWAGVLWIFASGLTTLLSAHTYASQDRLALTWSNSQPESIRANTFLVERLFIHRQYDTALGVIDKMLARHPGNAWLAANRTYIRCVQGSLDQGDVDQLRRTFQTAGYSRGAYLAMKTLRIMAFNHKCPALNPESWLQLDDAMLANPSFQRSNIAMGYLHYQKQAWAVSKGNLDMAVNELQKAYRYDPDANAPRLEAKYLVSAGLYDQAISVLRHTDYSRLPLLRRLLVDDRAINAEDIKKIEVMKNHAEEQVVPGTTDGQPASSSGSP